MPTKSQLVGVNATMNILQQLTPDLKELALKVAARKTAQALAKQIKAKAPTDNLLTANNQKYRTLKKNIKAKPIKNKRGIAYKKGFTHLIGTGDAYWATFIEYGTTDRQNKRGANRGSVNPQPFFEPTAKQFAQSALQIYAQIAEIEFAKVLNQYSQQYRQLSSAQRRRLGR